MFTQTVGIDLGTSASRIASFRSGSLAGVGDASFLGDSELPSALFVDGDLCIVGSEAESLLGLEAPGHAMSRFKNLLGRDVSIPTSNGTSLDVTMATSLLIKKMLRAFRNLHGFFPDRAVMSVPVWYSLAARDELAFAAHAAGLNAIYIVDEPIAAARYLNWLRRTPFEKMLVVDVGAGPATVSCLAFHNGACEPIRYCTDHSLTSEIFHAKLLDQVLGSTLASGDSRDAETKALRRVFDAAIDDVLSETDLSIYRRYLMAGAFRVDLALAKTFFKSAITSAVDDVVHLVQECCRSAEFSVGPDTAVLLVGGFNSSPAFRAELVDRLGLTDADGDGTQLRSATVLGAALLANEIDCESFQTGSTADFSVVGKISLQIKTPENQMESKVIIDTGTKLPCSLQIPVYSGNSGSDWVQLKFTQKVGGTESNLYEHKFGPLDALDTTYRIDVRVDYALSGQITITISDPHSGRSETETCKELVGGDRLRAAKRAAIEQIRVL